MYQYKNNNPIGHYVGDCVVRALSEVLDEKWEQVYTELCVQGFVMCDMPSSNHVWGAYLQSKGYEKNIISDDYTVADFAKDNPTGRYVLATGTHVIAVIDGNYIDTWDSGDEIPVYYWREL